MCKLWTGHVYKVYSNSNARSSPSCPVFSYSLSSQKSLLLVVSLEQKPHANDTYALGEHGRKRNGGGLAINAKIPKYEKFDG